jgi:hypothetical protein
MKIQFLADENLRRAIVLGLRRREPTVNFKQAYEVGATGRDDASVLRIAAEQNRILVSHDVRTMPQHFRELVARQTSPGVILIPQKLSLNTAIEQLLLIWVASGAEDWIDQIRFLPL